MEKDEWEIARIKDQSLPQDLSWFEPPEFTWQSDEVRNAPAHHWTISSGSKIEPKEVK